MSNSDLSSSALKVQAALDSLGLPCQVVELSDSTRTSQEAAQAIGTTVAQIVKTLVFKGSQSGEALLVLASGVNRVSVTRLSELAGEPVEKASADFVRERTGYVIGGVPPVGHAQILRTWIDEDLLQFNEVWTAAGTPHAVFRVDPLDLPRMTDGKIASVKE